AEQILQDEDRDIDAGLDPADEILADDLAAEDAIGLVVERITDRRRWERLVHHQTPRRIGISSDWTSTASVAGSGPATRIVAQSSRRSSIATVAGRPGSMVTVLESRSNGASRAIPASPACSPPATRTGRTAIGSRSKRCA